MKLFLQTRNSCLLAVILIFMVSALELPAQTLAISKPVTRLDYQDRAQNLSFVLAELAKKFGTEFNYDAETVDNKKVTEKTLKSIQKKPDLESSLQELLSPFGLNYRKFEDATYAIFPKQQGSDIKKLEEKIGERSSVEDISKPAQGKRQLLPSAQMMELMYKNTRQLAQTVSGKVTDGESGEPLPGVNVLAKGTTNGTVTDVDGNYRLTVGDDISTLVFSSIGFQPEEIAINGQSVINVTLSPDIQSLSEVVVVGYGTQKRSDLTGAISSVTNKELAEVPAGNVMEQSQGRLAGVDIVKNNGSPGSPVQIRIRGNRSINAGNDPLYVIDGIPTSADINNFNPNDIESMEVLKDASAVAIYGSRGANGVILITTKKGKAGKPVISYDGYYGIKQPVENIDLMSPNEFAAYTRVSRGINPTDNSQDNSFLSDVEVNNLQNGVSTDWLDLVLQNGRQQDHQISISGGTEDIRYYLSGSYYDEEGIVKTTDFNRVAARANIEANLTKKLKVGVSSTIATTLRNQMENSLMNDALLYSPLITPYDENGDFVAYPNPREGQYANPLLNLQPNQYRDETKNYRIFANIYAEYQITKDLTYRLNYGPDYNTTRRGRFNGSLDGSTNTASIESTNEFVYTFENILTYDKAFDKHHVNVVGLFSTQKSNANRTYTAARDIPIERATFNDLSSASTITGVDSDLSSWGLLSYMGRINYSFNNRYLVTLTGRADGSSRLANGNKWAFFPAVSLGWNLTEENFFNVRGVSFAKLRASYGEVGNTSIDPYQTLGGLARTIYAFGTSEAYGFGQNLIPNPDLGWEISKTVNIGVDFGFLEDRITGSFEYYRTKTDDLLLERLIPSTSGYNSILQNIGATQNKGWEFSLSANLINSPQGFKWNAGLNVFSNKEEITELFEGAQDDVGNQWFIGQPINVFYSFKQAGIWQEGESAEAEAVGQEPGDIKLTDVNGRDENGALTKQPDGTINSDDRTVLGSTVPNWSGGINNRFSYKGIDLSFLVYARQGQLLRSDYHYIGGNNWQGRYNALDLNYWTPNNAVNKYPMPDAGQAPLYSDAVRYFDGSFVKIKNITLGYNFPENMLERVGLSSLKIYATANNAFIFSKYDTVDPETSNGIVGDDSPLTTATYILGINLKF